MAPFRPANINKRLYPGNANVIGPTTITSLGLSTTTCFSSTNTCSACCCQPLCLGCRCSFCSCPCCNICCSCSCTVCTRTVPSGMWKSSEQYKARIADSWGNPSCSNAAAVCLCCTDIGTTCIGNIVDCKGFFWCCGGAVKYFVSPSCTEVNTNWDSRSSAVTSANNNMGACGWYVPGISELGNAYNCRSYWDSYSNTHYWSATQCYGRSAVYLNMSNGFVGPPSKHGPENKSQGKNIRAFRCTTT